jgi:hypothetical protein
LFPSCPLFLDRHGHFLYLNACRVCRPIFAFMKAPLRLSWIRAGALACFIGCLGDLIIPELLGSVFPGYNPLQQPESILGAAGSPVVLWNALWSVLLGVLITIFALGFRQAFRAAGPAISWGAGLLILYGLGQGPGSGLIPYNRVGQELTPAGKLHIVFSTIGETALFVFPLIPQKYLSRYAAGMARISAVVFMAGSLLLLVYGAAKLGLLPYRGLYQRLILLLYYCYLMYLARVMVRTARL